MTLAILILTAVVASTISGIIGMGGGILLLAVMASLLDPVSVVPIHGVVQLVSNSTRSLRLLQHVLWSIFLLYVPALGAGAFIGIRLYAGADAPWFRPAIGAFVLAFLLWNRVKPKRLLLPRWIFLPAGFVGGILTVVVGATGPFLAAFFLRDDLDRRQVVATKAAIQTAGHVVKIPAFLSIGFDYGASWWITFPLAACVVLGTFLGTSVLGRLDDRSFRVGFQVVLFLLALRLLFA